MVSTGADFAFQQAFGELSDLPFPPGSEIEAVAELHAELAYYDGYVAGLLLSDTPKSRIPKPDTELLGRMKSTLRQHPASSELTLYIEYMEKIVEVLELAKTTTGVYPRTLWARIRYRLGFR
jgi:hypothetical protein